MTALPHNSSSRRSLVIFLGWALLAWTVCMGIGILLWLPRWSAFPNTFAAIAGTAVMFLGTRHVLRRDGLGFGDLGLSWDWRSVRGFGWGWLVVTPVIVAVSAALAVAAKAQWQQGSATWPYALIALHAYFWASLLEELLFRGYLQRRLIEAWGRTRALAVIALAFGLFHLPGMSGIAAIKMVCTTAACSLLFSALVLRSGTLWSAVAGHMALNWLLHTVIGGTGKTAFFALTYATETTTGLDVSFWSLLLALLATAWAVLPKRRAANVASLAKTPSWADVQ